jgi:hypothetical protein
VWISADQWFLSSREILTTYRHGLALVAEPSVDAVIFGAFFKITASSASRPYHPLVRMSVD